MIGEEVTKKVIIAETMRILMEIDKICKLLGLRYWLFWGTLIGAIRHHGFIPWDDDLDIAMPRNDYELFLAYCDLHQDELWPLVALHETPGRRLPFTITRMSNTTYRQIGEYGTYVDELGIFVDIYPLDGLGRDFEQARRRKKECSKHLVRYMQASCFEPVHKRDGRVRRVLKRCRAAFLRSPEMYHARMMALATEFRFDESEYVANATWAPGYDDMIFRRAAFDKTIYVDFEGAEAPVPSCYDEILSKAYGDYMELPPKTDRVGHHFYSIVRR